MHRSKHASSMAQLQVAFPTAKKNASLGVTSMASGMSDDRDLEEAKRIMARMLSMPPKPHKAESAERKAVKAGKAPSGKRSEVKDSHDRYANIERKKKGG
jgi:hypothetical protein